MTLKLYCFGESGNAYKAALALELSGLDWEPVFVDFFGGETRAGAYRAEVNEMGEVPVLVDGDTRLTQSGAIQQYVTDRTGKHGGAPEDRYEVLRWVLWDNHKLSSQAGMTRFLMNFLPEEKRPADVIAFMQGPPQIRLCHARRASRGARLDRRRRAHQCRPVVLRLPLLPRTLRLRPRRLAAYRRLAHPPFRDTGLATPL